MEKVIYQIRNLVNGKLYIGSTINFNERKKLHISTMSNNKARSFAMQRAWNKYGKENFVFEILEYVEDSLDLVWVEEEYILLYDTIKNGYNIKLPYTEQKLSQTTYLNTSQSALDWYKTNAPNGLKTITPQEWLHQRNINPKFTLKDLKIKNPSNQFRNGIEIIGVDKEGNVLHTFRTIFQAIKYFKDLGIQETIRKCVTKNKLYKGIYHSANIYWYEKDVFDLQRFLNLFKELMIKKEITFNRRHVKKENIIPYLERNLRRRSISIQCLSSNKIESFKSLVECADFLKCKRSTVSCLVKGFKKEKNRIKKVNSLKGYKLYTI